MSKRILSGEETRGIINEFTNLILDLRKIGYKDLGRLIASLGEFLAYLEILNIDAEAEFLSGQSGADIELKNGKRIEVKTARFGKEYRLWGFGRIKPSKFAYLICVALDEELKPDFFIFTREEAEKLPTEEEAHEGRTKRFNRGSDERTFHRFKAEDEKIQPSKTLRGINRDIEKYQDWKRIK